MLASSKIGSNFAALKTKNGPLAQLNRAFDYGSKVTGLNPVGITQRRRNR